MALYKSLMSILEFVHTTTEEEGASSELGLAEMLHSRIVNEHINPSVGMSATKLGTAREVARASGVLIRGRIHRQSGERLSGICDSASEH